MWHTRAWPWPQWSISSETQNFYLKDTVLIQCDLIKYVFAISSVMLFCGNAFWSHTDNLLGHLWLKVSKKGKLCCSVAARSHSRLTCVPGIVHLSYVRFGSQCKFDYTIDSEQPAWSILLMGESFTQNEMLWIVDSGENIGVSGREFFY